MEDVTKKPVVILIEHYAQSHQNPINERIHLICVPLIMWTLLGFIWSLHPLLAAGFTTLALIYYFTLSVKLGLGMVLVSVTMLAVLYLLPEHAILPLSITVFSISWVGQFVGHYIEGKKPSFFEDVRYLLIGPLFVLEFFYRRCRISL